jgi:hypothetical protein
MKKETEYAAHATANATRRRKQNMQHTQQQDTPYKEGNRTRSIRPDSKTSHKK